MKPVFSPTGIPQWFPNQPEAGRIYPTPFHIVMTGYGLNGKWVLIDREHAQNLIDCLQAALDWEGEE